MTGSVLVTMNQCIDKDTPDLLYVPDNTCVPADEVSPMERIETLLYVTDLTLQGITCGCDTFGCNHPTCECKLTNCVSFIYVSYIVLYVFMLSIYVM